MSSDTISVKRHNHCVHPCDTKRKNELLNFLLKNNTDKSILIVTSDEIEELKNLANENVTVLTDSELTKDNKLKCDMLISYDLPDTSIVYMVRLAHAIIYASILLDEGEHKKLYPIETLLERALKQEVIKGFEPDSLLQERAKASKEQASKARKNNERSGKHSQNSKSKYLGKDENGKAMFSGRSGERNHRYDGTPKHNDEKVSTRRRTGKKINIKALKPKKESE